MQKKPAGHIIDTVVLGQKDPAGHCVCVIVPEGQNEPMLQFSAIVLLGQKNPTGHCCADMDPDGQKVPIGHWTDVAGVEQKVPIGHCLADVDGTGQCVPNAQLMHTEPSKKVPAAQLHDELLPSPTYPGGQVWQTVETPSTKKVPAPQQIAPPVGVQCPKVKAAHDGAHDKGMTVVRVAFWSLDLKL
jgi:hypothetical protein